MMGPQIRGNTVSVADLSLPQTRLCSFPTFHWRKMVRKISFRLVSAREALLLEWYGSKARDMRHVLKGGDCLVEDVQCIPAPSTL